jgi:hypothetical protein
MTTSEFQQLERISRLNLRMYDLTFRERRIGEVLIDRSFARGRSAALMPRLQTFCRLTGLYPGDVSETLKLMIAKKIVMRRGPRDAREYEFFPFAVYWQETKPLFDVGEALAEAAELDRQETQGKLPVQEPDLDDGLAEVSRENAIAHDDAFRGEEEISDLLTKPVQAFEISDSLISEDGAGTSRAYARGETLRNVRVQNVTKRPQFADSEKNLVFESLEQMARGPDFDRYRGKWIQRVQQFPGVLREAIGDVRLYLTNPRNKAKKSVGALIFRRAQTIARERGKQFHLW